MKLLAVADRVVLQAAPTSGRYLGSTLREFMQSKFHTNFGGILLHDCPDANRIVKRLGAEACTIGSHILFAKPFAGNIEVLAHELTHVVQNRRFHGCEQPNQTVAASIANQNGDIELEARQVAARIAAGVDSGPITGRLNAIACTAVSKAVEQLISYSATDWEVTTAEERQVITLLTGDTSPINTIGDLRLAGMLDALVDRVDGSNERLELMQVLGAKLDDANVDSMWSITATLGDSYVPGFLFRISHDLQKKLRALGVTSAAPVFNTGALAYVVGRSATSPFGGSGATGLNPTTRPEIPTTDRIAMTLSIESVRQRYHNPLGDLGVYLSSLSPQERKDQAELLLRQPVSSIVPYSYLGSIPSRADVMKAAAAMYNLHGPAIAAFILAEQRDQSANEDAKDYQSAVSALMYNSSIGLGQVVVSTARNNNLFGDVLRTTTLKGIYGTGLSQLDIAMLLASDDFNIFAAAKYIRKTANSGSSMTRALLPRTVATWPGVDFAKYAQNSRDWPDDNIAALGSEYTSTPWDDRVTAWGDFVLEAYRDVIRSGVF